MLPSLMEATRKQAEEHRKQRLAAETDRARLLMRQDEDAKEAEAALPIAEVAPQADADAAVSIENNVAQIQHEQNLPAPEMLPPEPQPVALQPKPVKMTALSGPEDKIKSETLKSSQESKYILHHPAYDKRDSRRQPPQIARFAFDAEEATVQIIRRKSDDQRDDSSNDTVSTSPQQHTSEHTQSSPAFNPFLTALKGQKKK